MKFSFNSYHYLFFIICFTFSPYIVGGIRLDSMLLYPIFLGYTIKMALTNSIFFDEVSQLGLVLLLAVLVCVLGNIFIDLNHHYVAFSAALNTLLFPAALFLSSNKFFCKIKNQQIIKLLRLILILSVFSALFAFLSIFVDVKIITQFFIRNASSGLTVSERAMQMGRFTGLFSQPVECGVYYSCTLFISVYLLAIKEISVKAFNIYFLTSILGGAVAVTKMFLLVGLPLGLIYLYKFNRRVFNRVILILILPIIAIAFYLVLLYGSPLLDSYLNLYNSHGLLYAITASRVGGQYSTTGSLFSNIISNGFINGMGIGNNETALDSAYLLYFFQGGIFSLLLYISFWLLLFMFVFKIKAKNPERTLLFIIAVYGLIASNGGPVLNANRANIVLVFLICSIIKILNNKADKNYNV